jgi:steroid 5-alpha reductase family enzyme
MNEIASLLGLNFALLILIILALWAYAVRIRDVSFIDAFWAFGMVLLAWSSWLQTDGQSLRAQIALALTTLWGRRSAIRKNHGWLYGGKRLELANNSAVCCVSDASAAVVHH